MRRPRPAIGLGVRCFHTGIRELIGNRDTGAERRTLAVGPLPSVRLATKRAERKVARHYGP
jgi:hypothetical protein